MGGMAVDLTGVLASQTVRLDGFEEGAGVFSNDGGSETFRFSRLVLLALGVPRRFLVMDCKIGSVASKAS
jgi:hypothetical protein